MTEVPVSGRVLKWARGFRGLSEQEAADKLNITIEELELYENGGKLPTLTKFEKFASVYQLPQATLFRRTEPTEPPMPKDFRTFDGAPPRSGYDFLVALSDVRTLQTTLSRIDREDEQFAAPALRRVDMKGDPFIQGETEREAIGMPIATQIDWQSGSGFRHWRALIERMGVAVYLQKFDLNDCRGCSLWEEEIAPAIIINKAEESDNARSFTLIHEYAHLLARNPGISDLRSENPTEAFCNRFAAAFLMPAAALRLALPLWPERAYEWTDDAIRNAATSLKVSAQALAIRLEELGKASEGFNRRFVVRAVKRQRKNEQANYVRTRLSEIGSRYVGTVLSAFDREIIDSVEVSRALALKPKHFESARKYVERQAELASVG